jgi:hypothetical protein
MRWPAGKLGGGREVDQITAHLDILPTFIDLLHLKVSVTEFDGTSLVELLYGDQQKLRDRTLVVESQRILNPEKWRGCSVMKQPWRLIGGKQLYNLETDPGQTTDVAGRFPEIVEQLRGKYENFWSSVSADHHIISRCSIGAEQENPTILTAMDHMTQKEFPAFNHGAVINKNPYEAPWMVNVEYDGNYEISIRRWPAEYDRAINYHPGAKKALGAKKAYLEIGDLALEQKIPDGAKEVTFKVKLKAGPAALNTGFVAANGERAAAMYAYVLNSDRFKGKIEGWQTREGLDLPRVDKDALRHADVPEILKSLARRVENL